MRASAASTSGNESAAALASTLQGTELLARVAQQQLSDLEDWRSERAEWQQELAWLRAMIDQVPDYLFVKDQQCRFVLANKAVASDLGRTPESIIGLTDRDLHPQSRSEEFMADDMRVVQTGQPMIDKEEFVVLPSGEQRWLSTSKLPLRDTSGQIVGLVGVARDITLRKHAEEQVRFLAYFDQLTKLPNRAKFEANFAKVSKGLEHDEEARLILIDLDRFKQVNDSLGHAAGDELLRSVAHRLTDLLGGRGHVARLGGDEFAIVTSFQSPAEERAFYDEVVRELRTFTIMGNEMHVGASVGISKVHNLTTPFAALREADIALYEAKSTGRNRWRAFERRMADLVETRQQLEADLRRALETGDQFLVEYQPVYDVTGTEMLGVEALVRWRHPELGLLGPDRFISIAEDQGSIFELGDLVLRRTCQLLARTDIPWAAVNVSPIQLGDDSFLDRMLSILAGEGVDPSRLELEITEGVVLRETGTTHTSLEQLRAAGIKVAIDDFGTGYSSLNYLSRLAVDKIKIDRSFVQALGSPKSDAIVCAVIAFSKALHLTVTAEGVETDEQRLFLENAGCDQLQGYLLARPMPEGFFQWRPISVLARNRVG